MELQRYNYVHDRWDSVNVTEEEKVEVLTDDIIKYIGRRLEWNDQPTIDEFLKMHDEWNFDRYNDKIEAEFNRILNYVEGA